MKKLEYMNNQQYDDNIEDLSAKKKEERNKSMISLQDNPLLYNSGFSFSNIPSDIPFKGKLFPTYYPITPIKKRKNLISSSKNNKNISNSELIWNKSNNVDNENNETFGLGKRKLIIDFNKSLINKNQYFNFELNNSPLKNENNLNINPILFTPKQKDGKEKDRKKEEDMSKKKETIVKINFNDKRTNKLFFTDYGLGYKCNCSKTGCNKYYCQCYNQGRYCYGCNCQNCNNKIPEHISCNKRPEEKKENSENIFCTCTKSGCNKNYCECYKNKIRCNSQCRCRNCENYENNHSERYECDKANSIYIIRNKIMIEDIIKKRNTRKIKKMIDDILSSFSSSSDNEIIGRKIKRSKVSEENTNESFKIKKLNECNFRQNKINL